MQADSAGARQEPEILVDTAALSEAEWLAWRRKGIGGSDVAAILGISPWRTARDLYNDKLGIASAQVDSANWVALEMGHLLEDLVARIFSQKTGYHVFQVKKMFRHPRHPCMLADVDYFVTLPDGNMWLAQQMFQRVRASCRIVLVGDPDQLPSVGAGQVFASLIKSGEIPVTVLDRIFRQSKDGLIAYNAKFINEGSTRLYYGSDFEFVESGNQQDTAAIIMKLYTDEIKASGIENVQILSPFRSRGEVSADLLNLAIRERVNPFRREEEDVHLGIKVFRVGDRVMQTKNTEKVSNGDLGFVRSIETRSDDKRVLLDFGTERLLTYRMEELANLDLAYATTIHKAMGSEFETVIVPVIKPHAIMLYRNLLYTAITRARKKVILVGQKSTLFLAIHKSDISKRNTKLADRIQMYSQVLAADHTTRLPEAV